MKKGKFGIVLCFYPIAAFAAAILNSPLVAVVLAAVAIFIERDEWAGRQALQAWMLSVIVSVFAGVSRAAAALPVPFLATALSVTSSVLYAIVYFCCLVLSILGIIRVMKGGEANVPVLAEIAYRIYGQHRPKPTVNTMPIGNQPMGSQPGGFQPNGYQPPYGYPQQPEQAQGQMPYPPVQYPQAPQAPYAQPHSAAPQNAQQQNAAPQYTPPVEQPQQPIQQGEDDPGSGSL